MHATPRATQELIECARREDMLRLAPGRSALAPREGL
jgi:hypothetical protein